METESLHIPVLSLRPFHRPGIRSHLLRLSPDDRRLRFGILTRDEEITRYVSEIDFSRGGVFGVFANDLTLIGMLHVGLDPAQRVAELGLSVDTSERNKGIGQQLLQRAILHAANAGCRALFMHCLSENQIILHLARKAGLRVLYDHGEAEAEITLDQREHGGLAKEMWAEQIALVDILFKQQFGWWRGALGLEVAESR